MEAADERVVRGVIASITITDPIKAAFAPKFEFLKRTQSLVTTISPFSADGSGQRIIVRLIEMMPPYQAGDEVEIVRFIRQTLIRTLSHELDESLFCNGKHVNDPHPERSRSDAAAS